MAQRGRSKKIVEPKPLESYLQKINKEVSSNQSKVSLVLGALIILVLGILIFNYFQRSKTGLGPAQTTTQEEQTKEGDVSPSNLPGKYTVKEGDTLFTIAEKYYRDGSKFEDLAKANNLTDVNVILVGQVLEIPKVAEETSAPAPSPSPTSLPQGETSQLGTGGGNTTIWGPRIEGDSYTVVAGDWLSKIAGRAYGDIFAYKKLAEVNHIPNPDLIFPGQALKIPR